MASELLNYEAFIESWRLNMTHIPQKPEKLHIDDNNDKINVADFELYYCVTLSDLHG